MVRLGQIFRWFAGKGRGLGIHRLGRKGEDLALRYLKRQGYKLIRRNYDVRGGEIDLIMRDGRTLVFVEVKTRSSETFATAESAVNYAKRKHLYYAARRFIYQYKLHQFPARFDVVAVVAPLGEKTQIRHHINAFKVPRAHR